jgi:formimidoylglutamate deiminase
MNADRTALFWAPRAWLRSGWHESVLLRADANGHWAEVTPGVPAPPGAQILAGPALPGMVDAHSHAFQRAFAGLAEHRTGEADTFWSWRDRMYQVALRVTPKQLRAIAAQLYVELLLGGYTQVCEFHYLHRRPDGTDYDDPLSLTWPLVEAAEQAGIGLTVLPAVYERAGFDQPELRDDQRRFRLSAKEAWAACQAVRAADRPLVHAGVAAHSLRAAAPESITELVRQVGDDAGPIHIHVAEQTAEVDACRAATGEPPVGWLASQGFLDSRWHLVHATHTTPAELDAVATSGANVVLCPTTEANLGDGLCDLPGLLSRDIPASVGSDSQVGRAWADEVRAMEYAQRLHTRRRNVAADPARGRPSSGERLFDLTVRSGGAAAGFARWGLTVGARADLLVLDPTAALGVPAANVLDSVVFSGPASPWRDVLVAGRWVVTDHRHPAAEATATAFTNAMRDLWG